MSFVGADQVLLVFEIIKFIDESVDDWNQVLPEAHQFLRDCQRFHAMIEPMKERGANGQQNGGYSASTSRTQVGSARFSTATSRTQIDDDKTVANMNKSNNNIVITENNSINNQTPFLSPGLSPSHLEVSLSPTLERSDQQRKQYVPYYPQQQAPISEIPIHKNQDAARQIIDEIVEAIRQSKHYAEEFLIEITNRSRGSWMQSIQWFFTRAFASGDYRAYFRAESERIRLLLGDLMLNEEITKQAAGPKVESFKDDMSNDSYMFWTKHLGDNITVEWCKFKDVYNLLYGLLEPVDEHYIKSVLISKDKKNPRVTVYGFIAFMQKHGFPFEKNIASRKAFEAPVMGEDKRMEIAKMVMNLVQEFASLEMQKHLISVYTWYAQTSKNDINAMQERANEWGQLVAEARDVNFVKTKAHIRANDVDSARRAVSLFYQEYMVMWRIGQVSREMFMDVDFPGKGRIKDFIK